MPFSRGTREAWLHYPELQGFPGAQVRGQPCHRRHRQGREGQPAPSPLWPPSCVLVEQSAEGLSEGDGGPKGTEGAHGGDAAPRPSPDKARMTAKAAGGMWGWGPLLCQAPPPQVPRREEEMKCQVFKYFAAVSKSSGLYLAAP